MAGPPWRLLLTCVLEVAGFLLKGPPADPDQLFGRVQLVGVFLVFLAFATSTLAWGRLLWRWSGTGGEPWLAAAAYGTAGAAFSAMALGHAGLIGEGWQNLSLGLLFAGPALDWRLSSRGRSPGRRANRLARPAHAAVLLLVFVLLAKASLMHGTSDPLLYHLLSPRLWWQAGSIGLPANAAIALQSSYWEYLSIWGNQLLAGSEGRGLIEGQLFGQWTHLALGFGGTGLALAAVFGRIARGPALLALVVTGALTASYGMDEVSWLAKNDWGVALWLFAGVELLLRRRSPVGGPGRWLAAGMFLGLALAAKWTAALFIVPFLGIWAAGVLWTEGRPGALGFRSLAGRLACLGGAMVLVIAPICLRNLAATGSPVYPILDNVFHSPWMSPSWQRMVERSHGTFRIAAADWWAAGQSILSDSVSYLGIFLFPLAAWSLGRRRLNARVLIAAAILSLLLFEARVIPHSFLRWAGPALLVLGGVSALALGEALARVFPVRGRWPLLAAAALAVLGGARARIPESWHQLFTGPSPALVIRTPGIHIGGDAKAWLRMNAGPGDLVVTSGDNQLYYVSALRIAPLPDQPALDAATRKHFNPYVLLRVLRSLGARYLLDSRHWDSPYWSAFAAKFERMFARYPEAIRYEGENSLVVDLAAMEESVRGACPADAPFPDNLGIQAFSLDR